MCEETAAARASSDGHEFRLRDGDSEGATHVPGRLGDLRGRPGSRSGTSPHRARGSGASSPPLRRRRLASPCNPSSAAGRQPRCASVTWVRASGALLAPGPGGDGNATGGLISSPPGALLRRRRPPPLSTFREAKEAVPANASSAGCHLEGTFVGFRSISHRPSDFASARLGGIFSRDLAAAFFVEPNTTLGVSVPSCAPKRWIPSPHDPRLVSPSRAGKSGRNVSLSQTLRPCAHRQPRNGRSLRPPRHSRGDPGGPVDYEGTARRNRRFVRASTSRTSTGTPVSPMPGMRKSGWPGALQTHLGNLRRTPVEALLLNTTRSLPSRGGSGQVGLIGDRTPGRPRA